MAYTLLRMVDRGEVDVSDDCVQHEAEVVGALDACVDVVGGGDTVEVIHVSFQAIQEQQGVPSRDGRDLKTSPTDCHRKRKR